MTLNEEELDLWMKAFARLDKKKTGKVTVESIFEFIEEYPSPYAHEIFKMCESEDEHKTVEFSDFIYCFGTYCFFGIKEIVKFMYLYVDKKVQGWITPMQLKQFLYESNPYTNKKRVWRAMAQMKLKADDRVTFDDFQKYVKCYPGAFNFGFSLQNSMRVATLVRKLLYSFLITLA